MTKIKIATLGGTLAIAISLLGVQAAMAALSAPAPFLSVVPGSGGETLQNPNLAIFSLSAAAEIPRTAAGTVLSSFPVYGFAWADVSTGNAFVVTVHENIPRDTSQNPDSWHPHVVTLANTGAVGTTPTTTGDDFCLTGLVSATAGITIQGSTMTVNVRSSELPESPASLSTVTAFVVQPDSGCSATGLGVATVS